RAGARPARRRPGRPVHRHGTAHPAPCPAILLRRRDSPAGHTPNYAPARHPCPPSGLLRNTGCRRSCKRRGNGFIIKLLCKSFSPPSPSLPVSVGVSLPTDRSPCASIAHPFSLPLL